MPACAPGMRPVGRHSETPPCSAPEERSRQRRDRVQSGAVPTGSSCEQSDRPVARAPLHAALRGADDQRDQRQSVQEQFCHAGHVRRRRCIPRSTPASLSALAGGLLIAPYFLFSALAGELADRYERARLLHILKGAELATVLLAAAALLAGNMTLSFLALFAARRPGDVFQPGALRAAAAASERRRAGRRQRAARRRHVSRDPVRDDRRRHRRRARSRHRGGLSVADPVRGFAASPRAFTCRPPRPRRPSCVSAATPSPRPSAILRQAWEIRDVKLSILGASWFWLVGAVFLSQIPAFAKETLGAGTGVVTLFLAAFSIGIGAGSVLCGTADARRGQRPLRAAGGD